MAIVNIITANCENNQLSQQMVSRQWDDKGTLIQFAGYPEPEGDEALIFRLIVWMKESEDAEPRELPPILLDSDQWLISNYYTQLVQTIKFQLCITNETGTYEKHSPVFAGHIGRSLSHNGQEGDIDVIPFFDPYMNYVDEKVNDLIVAAGDVQIDASLSTSGAAADAKATGDAIAGVNGRLGELEQLPEEVNAITDKLQKVEGANQLNPAEAESGKFLNGTTGITSNNASYFTSGYIPVTEGDVVRVFTNNLAVNQMRTTAFYDSGKVFIPGSGTTSGVNSVTAPAGAAYVRFSAGGATSYNTKMCLLNVETPPAFIPYVTPHYVATDEFIGEINVNESTDFQSEYLDYSNVNRLDPDACSVGKFISTTGEISDNDAYFVTDFMPIRSGETLYIFRKDKSTKSSFRTIAAYDKDKNIIKSLGVNGETVGYTQQGNTAYIRASIIYQPQYYNHTPYGLFVLPVSNPGTLVPGYNNSPVFVGEYTRKTINIYATDTEAEVIEKMVSAYNQTHCDVVFERATYNFGEGLAAVGTDYHLYKNEIPIGNDCRYFFNGATLNAVIDLSQHPGSGDDEFYVNLLGTQYRPTNFELHDGILKATDTRYVVHDEASAVVGSYRHVYDNMVMVYQTSARTEAIRKCIGGGTGASGVVEITGCKFISDNSDSCVSWHGNSDNVVGAEFMLNVRNSWFSNSLRCGTLSADQTARLFYSGNSGRAAPVTYDRWDVTSFLNEVRT